MKKLIIFITMLTSVSSFAFPQVDLGDMDLVDLTHSSAKSLFFVVQYPGLGDGHSNTYDCLILRTPKWWRVSTERLLSFGESIVLKDGDAILFGNRSGRTGNELIPEINSTRQFLFYRLKDIGKYITGLKISPKDKSKTLSEVTREVFGQRSGLAAFQFSRSCSF